MNSFTCNGIRYTFPNSLTNVLILADSAYDLPDAFLDIIPDTLTLH